MSKEDDETERRFPFRQSGQERQGATPPTHESRHRGIPLSRGKVALVDAEDFDRVNTSRWSCQPNGKKEYALRGVRQPDGSYRSELMHRFILNAPPGVLVDHVNGDGLDNRRANLRLCSPSENNANKRVRGTSRSRSGKWVARVKKDGVLHWLGTFADEAEAAEAYRVARATLFGAFAGEQAGCRDQAQMPAQSKSGRTDVKKW